MNQKEAISKAPEGRVRRSPLGRKQILRTEGKDPAYEYRFVTDENGRVEQFVDNDWEFVTKDQVKVGERRVERASPEGSKSQVDLGQGRKGFLMRIKKEFYLEDQAAKQDSVNESEASMKQPALDGKYGKLEISRS